MTFTERQLALIGEWHHLPFDDPRAVQPLHTYLGLTWDEYKVVAGTSIIIEDSQKPQAACGCPIEIKTMRILRHTRECSQRQSVERFVERMNQEYGEDEDAGDR